LTAIVVDTSAVVAILRNEPEKDGFVDAILAAAPRFMSAVSLQEAGLAAAGRLGDDAILQLLDELLVRLDVEIVTHDASLARIAWEAFLRFGRSRHPARLNFGDCAAYALARAQRSAAAVQGRGFHEDGHRGGGMCLVI
jgi:ribonuclease VapC